MNPKNLYQKAKKGVRGTALAGLTALSLAGCAGDKNEELYDDKSDRMNVELYLRGIVGKIEAYPSSNKLDVSIKIPRDMVYGNKRLDTKSFLTDTAKVSLELDAQDFLPGFPLSVGDEVFFVLTGGFREVKEIKQTDISSGRAGPFYKITSWPAKGRITSYNKRGNQEK